ncbi:DUF2852 domain-containing protein [Aquicoccus porphyridii]|uniref:DUF2852 domain-containing protein n=1 Tax=Aquicoccus porphyridii TaxID=1852029 RepID=A0A5A9ZSL2_9RHOB|nr:DUF2852 domain-containing protein [Aquicoccus porphyridii]KAA0920139.1 DUF2852 domain-containing protein [Aquicoccus porphyridii]RAI55062.1 hypothetical protein DOO74_07600 [Rhodobacteraceae bacterium AsT-22]
MTTATHGTSSPAPIAWLRRAEDWLDDKGKGAWIAAMVLGFILFWPIGLALLAYMIWSKQMFKGCAHRRKHGRPTAYRSSGNSAFDAYKDDTLRRLEDEQKQFESFLERLRAAKDKAEFDQFMEDRASDAAKARSAEPPQDRRDPGTEGWQQA